MIHFRSIQWKNFLSTGNNWVKIDLDKQPATLIVGENGAGKSTILDALTFSLFGKPFRKVNKPQLVNTINDGECLVEVSFTVGTMSYVVRRGIKPSVFEIIVNDQPLNQLANNRDFQELLETQILKLNYKSFTQVVVLGSSTFVPFMQLPAAHRREVIEDLLDIQIFSAMNFALKQKVSSLKDDLSETQSGISLQEQLIAVQSENLKRMAKGNQEIIDQHMVDITTHQSEVEQWKTLTEKHQKTIIPLEARLIDDGSQKRKLREAQNIDSKLQGKENTINREISFYDQHDECPTCQQDIDGQFKTSMLQNKQEKLSEIDLAREDIKKLLDKLDSTLLNNAAVVNEISNIRTNISSLDTKIKATERIIQTLESNIKNLSEKGDVSKVEAEISEASAELEKLTSKKEEFINTSEIHKVASSLLKDSGIKTIIIKQYLPIMNNLINKHLASMDFFVNFNLDENFNETIKSRHRDDFSYASFSEGEKMRIDLALLFTWRAVAKLKNSTNTNLLILDEVFDSSLDDSGTQEFLKILYTLGKDQNVFVISHKGDVLQDKFNTTIRFEKVKGYSKVV